MKAVTSKLNLHNERLSEGHRWEKSKNVENSNMTRLRWPTHFFASVGTWNKDPNWYFTGIYKKDLIFSVHSKKKSYITNTQPELHPIPRLIRIPALKIGCNGTMKSYYGHISYVTSP